MMTTPVVHELKTIDPHYEDIVEGLKTFEMRRDDRAYAAGDVLHLRQYDPKLDAYSGYGFRVRVTHLLRGPCFGLADGWVIMSIAAEDASS